MSRLLGCRARLRRQCKTGELVDVSPEAEGRRMFERGEPCPRFEPVRGECHRINGEARARWRGWQRAAAAARKGTR